MRKFNKNMWFMALLLVVFLAGCGGGGGGVVALIDAEDDSVNPGTCTSDGPKVISSNITDGDTGVSIQTAGYNGKLITATFSDPMNPWTIRSDDDPLTFTLREGEGLRLPIDGTVTMDITNTIATFETDDPLDTNTEYEITITQFAERDADNKPLSCSYRWSFTTGSSTVLGQLPVDLGTASTYGIFARAAGITLAVDSLVNGDVGLNPAGACGNCVEGVTVLNGVIENGTAAAIQAATDIQTAYDEASVRATGACTLSSPSDISAAQADCNGFTPGPTYRAGLYRTADPIGFTGTITLDAQGDSNAVFIFQTDAALTTASNSVVVLTGGAKANNVFWITGAAATLGVSSIFKGTVIANASAITVMNGVDPSPLTDVEGRMLAGAAITVSEFATVTVPTP